MHHRDILICSAQQMERLGSCFILRKSLEPASFEIDCIEQNCAVSVHETIKNFLDVLRNDPSLDVRERVGCSLAKSGMLTREQRMKAVPGLIELADDPSLDATTRNWVYQALREITNVNLPNDSANWRNWYSAHGAEKAREFGKGDSWSVLGNS